MRKTSLMMCCSAALVLGAAGCTGDRDTLAMPGSPAVTAPDTRPMDDAAPIDPSTMGSTAKAHQTTGLSVATGTHGRYLVDGQGRALYVLENDTDGRGCTGACLQVWPPLRADQSGAAAVRGATAETRALTPAEMPKSAGAPDMPGTDLRVDSIETIERPDGITQMTYNGHPLYHYARDQGSGDSSGHHVQDEWGEWYLVGPEGDLLEEQT
ncbi:MAG: hypothetical protein M3414_09160 [Pseudomonadota bacterium]|nr:hypothetical protein [Pseudomonadota bacterium]